jgi:preprotein translocase subunit YajC
LNQVKEGEKMSIQLSVGDAVRHIDQGVIVRITRIDADLITVETPSGDTSQHPSGALKKLALNSLELAVAFDKVLDGWAWGGWNTETIA